MPGVTPPELTPSPFTSGGCHREEDPEPSEEGGEPGCRKGLVGTPSPSNSSSTSFFLNADDEGGGDDSSSSSNGGIEPLGAGIKHFDISEPSPPPSTCIGRFLRSMAGFGDRHPFILTAGIITVGVLTGGVGVMLGCALCGRGCSVPSSAAMSAASSVSPLPTTAVPSMEATGAMIITNSGTQAVNVSVTCSGATPSLIAQCDPQTLCVKSYSADCSKAEVNGDNVDMYVNKNTNVACNNGTCTQVTDDKKTKVLN